jgi:hypothetical protein
MNIPFLQRAIIRTYPSSFMGFRFEDWTRLLREHPIEAPYWSRCTIATPTSGLTSFLSIFEESIEKELPHGDEWRRPVFIIGLPSFDSLARVLQQDSGYEKNIHEPLSPDAKTLLRHVYAPVYEQGIY